jgi:hypothetical protein
VEVGGSLNNTGAVPLEGTARLSLVALDRCACEGERCSCREERLALGERAVAMGPGDWLDLEAAATTLGRANASVQALVEVADARGAVVASGRSPISHVVDAGPLAVRDAYFLGPGGRTTEAYPGAAVTASAVLDSAVAPAAVSLSLVKAGEGVPGSAAFYRLDRTGTTLPLSTGRYTAAEGDVGQVVSVHVKALGPNGTVLLDRTLVQQGIVPGTCQEAMTRRCLDQLGARGPSFPSTFVQVRRLALSVASSAFMDEGGREVGSVEGGADLSAAAVVRNGMAAASKASLTGARSLEPGDKALVLVDRFRATAPGTYGLRLRASDAGGRVWLDETASARLEARPAAARPSPTPGPAPAPSPGPGQAPGPSAAPPAGAPPPIASLGSIDTTIGVEGCRFTVRCEGCSSGCKLVLDAERCTLATRDCGCMCGSAPGRGAGGAGAQQA